MCLFPGSTGIYVVGHQQKEGSLTLSKASVYTDHLESFLGPGGRAGRELWEAAHVWEEEGSPERAERAKADRALTAVLRLQH